MYSEEVQIGTKVRVGDDHRRPELRGLTGIIEQTYGRPDYLALDVLLDNGMRELFWYYQLEEDEQ